MKKLAYGILDAFDWLPALLTRVSIGVMFFQSGLGKLKNIDKVVAYFTSLGIPAPGLQAPFVAGVEFFGGTLLVLGLLTRLISVPLIGVMAVAILTAKMADLSSVTDLFFLPEFLCALLLIWLVFFGAGRLSLDRMIFGKKGK